MPKFSANLGFLWSELPLLERIDAAARAGFRAVELHSPYDHDAAVVGRRCRDAGVALLGINTDITADPRDRGCAAIPGRGADAQALIDKGLAFVEAAGGTALHVMAGFVPPEDHEAGTVALLHSLDYAAPRADRLGLTILLEVMNPRDMPGYFYRSIEEARALVDAIGSPRIRLMFDCYHIAILQGDVISRLRTQMPAIGHVQIAAVPSRAEPDEGELSYPAIFRELDTQGYDGWVGCEYRPRAGTDQGLGWLAWPEASPDTSSASASRTTP